MCRWHRTLMRHILLAQPVTAVSFGMLEAASSALLVAPAGFLDASAACGLRAASGTIDLAPVAAAADDDLASTAMAQEESAGGFHWRFPSRQGAIDRKRPLVKYSPCTRAQHGVGHDIGVNFAGLAGVVLVLLGGPFLPHREPVCHPRLDPLAASAANFPSGRRAAGGRVFSRPSGSFRHAPPPHHRWPNRPQHPDSSRPRTIPRRQPPLRLAANYRHFLTAIDISSKSLRSAWDSGATAQSSRISRSIFARVARCLLKLPSPRAIRNSSRRRGRRQ